MIDLKKRILISFNTTLFAIGNSEEVILDVVCFELKGKAFHFQAIFLIKRKE